MSRTYAGKDANGGLYHALKGLHLAWLTDTCFEDSYLGIGIESPHTQRHTYLRVITTRRACHHHIGRQHLIEPFLDDGFTITTCDTYHGDGERFAMTLCQALQSHFGIGHHQLYRLLEPFLRGIYHKGSHSSLIEVLNIEMAITALCAYGKKQGTLGKTKASAIGQEPLYGNVGIAHYLRSQKGCYLCYSHSLFQIISTASMLGCKPSSA